MFDAKDIKILNYQSSFDPKAFFVKLLGYWKLFFISISIALIWAYQVNIRKESIYGMESSIVVKEENNPLFTNNTSLIFNWGGTSDKVQTIITTLKSRTHNEHVVDRLQYYIKYLKKGDYFFEDVYGTLPYKVTIDKKRGQIAGHLIKIIPLSSREFEMEVDFDGKTDVMLYHYFDNSISSIKAPAKIFKRKFRFNEVVDLPFFKGQFDLNSEIPVTPGQENYLRFDDFNGTVAGYRSIYVDADTKALSVIKLELQGSNKARLVEYLNTTVELLKENELRSKNLFAVNTINFIDSTLQVMEGQLKASEADLKRFKKNINVYELESGGEKISDEISSLDIEQENIKRKLAYCNHLKTYLEKNTEYAKLPAPAVAGIDDPNIIANVSKLIQLSIERSDKSFSYKNPKLYADLDVQMESIKRVLLNNIESFKSALAIDLRAVNGRINEAEGSIRMLPEQQQDLINITRKYDLKEKIFSTLLERRNEADIVKAANISDIDFIDSAKDVGGGFN